MGLSPTTASGTTGELMTEVSSGHIFSCVRPFCERALSDLDRSMNRSLWVQVAHRSFIEGSHVTKNGELGKNGRKAVGDLR